MQLPPTDSQYDAVVVGSGFGGSVVAHRLAEEGWDVCVLERGRWHRPGAFPRTPAEVKQSFWDPSHGLYGMYDVWSFAGLAAVVASGMGGGSLIYANVLARAPEGWLRVDGPDGGPWPLAPGDLDAHYEVVENMLQPTTEPLGATAKTRAFRRAARRAALEDDPPPLAIQFKDDAGKHGIRLPFGDPEQNHYGVQRLTCEMRGECDFGCNLGAKHTLDLTYLSATERFQNVDVHELAEVRTIRRADGGGFEVDFRRHALESGVPMRNETVRCTKLILAAGTLGTALLLLRNRLSLRGLSRALGRGFCANGDYVAFAADCDAVDGEPIDATHGPVITASARGLDRQDGGDGPGFHLQDGGFPRWGSWLAEAADPRLDLMRVAAAARSVAQGRNRRRPQKDLAFRLSELVGDAGERLLPILSFGRDNPDGRLLLRGDMLDLDWRKDESAGLYERAESAARSLAAALGGRYVDPLRLWRPITAHPLGGCAMSRNPYRGVVDEHGCVHNVDDLSIADGSVLPGPVGINPALTIAALAHRHAQFLVEKGRPKR
jgi:cholesterol oxidase